MPKPAPSPFPPKTDFFSKQGAHMLADHIMVYWAKRGHGKVVAEPYAMRGLGAWGVKSNLWNGLPRGRVKKGKPIGAAVQAERTAAELAARRREFLG